MRPWGWAVRIGVRCSESWRMLSNLEVVFHDSSSVGRRGTKLVLR